MWLQNVMTIFLEGFKYCYVMLLGFCPSPLHQAPCVDLTIA